MEVTATEAKNRLGQVLDAAQSQPVTIEKNGRRHSVILSAERYDELLRSVQPQLRGRQVRTASDFYKQHKEWVDAENARFERIGPWNEEFRTW